MTSFKIKYQKILLRPKIIFLSLNPKFGMLCVNKTDNLCGYIVHLIEKREIYGNDHIHILNDNYN